MSKDHSEEARAETPEPLVVCDVCGRLECICQPRMITDTRPGGIVRGNGEGCRVPFGQGIRLARK